MDIFLNKDHFGDKKININHIHKPKFYLVQLGFEAKLRVLNVVEDLRKAKIALHHFIHKDKITAQLSNAENLKATHLLIIGKKEAIEGTVVVRNISTREQDTVFEKDLVIYLKGLKS